MERMPQPMPDSERAGHYLAIFETPTHDENGLLRKPDDCLPRKNLKDLFDQKEIGLEQLEAIKKFSQEVYVKEKHLNDYLRHLQDIEIRKDIRAREKGKDKGREYKGFSWSDIITDGKLSKLRVRELDLYLTQHGLNTTGLKPDKVKAIDRLSLFSRKVAPNWWTSPGWRGNLRRGRKWWWWERDNEWRWRPRVWWPGHCYQRLWRHNLWTVEEMCTMAFIPDEALELQLSGWHLIVDVSAHEYSNVVVSFSYVDQ